MNRLIKDKRTHQELESQIKLLILLSQSDVEEALFFENKIP